jgi:protein TonB
VAAEFTITAHGRTQDIRIVSAHPAKIFNRAARHAIARWQFTPAMLNGQPVAVIMHQTIRFKLKQKE